MTVDNTPPEVLLELRDAYQSKEVIDPNSPDGPKQRDVSVDPGIFWRATDPNLYAYIIESGVGQTT